MSLRTVLDVVYKTMTDSIDLWSPPARPIFSQNLLIIFAVFCFTYDIYIYIYTYIWTDIFYNVLTLRPNKR